MPEFPLFLAEIDVQSISCVRFTMPANDIGRDDVQIYVEYGISISDDQKLTCNVWAYILNTSLKGYLLTIDVDKPEKSEDKIDVILKALNGSNDFYAVLHHYLTWADENLLRKENR